MTLNMSREAGSILIQAYGHATRLRHPYLAGEHYLLALAAADQPVGEVLREYGVTPERVEAEIVSLSGAGLFGDLDREALTAVGIDVDAVRAATEAAFGRETLARAARDVHRGPGRFSPRRRSGATRAGVFLPHGPGVNQALLAARREANARHADQTDTDDLALGLLAAGEGLVTVILARMGTTGPALRTAILDRCHPAKLRPAPSVTQIVAAGQEERAGQDPPPPSALRTTPR
jgi:ATP-dependent Clp protease ATP-binding subunit ClpA